MRLLRFIVFHFLNSLDKTLLRKLVLQITNFMRSHTGQILIIGAKRSGTVARLSKSSKGKFMRKNY